MYNLDMILSVGYRVNSKRGIAFRKWANNVLNQYVIQGYAINEKPDGAVPVYRITYEDCKEMVGKMRDSFDTDVFGVEKEAGKAAGIIAAVYITNYSSKFLGQLFLKMLLKKSEECK